MKCGEASANTHREAATRTPVPSASARSVCIYTNLAVTCEPRKRTEVLACKRSRKASVGCVRYSIVHTQLCSSMRCGKLILELNHGANGFKLIQVGFSHSSADFISLPPSRFRFRLPAGNSKSTGRGKSASASALALGLGLFRCLLRSEYRYGMTRYTQGSGDRRGAISEKAPSVINMLLSPEPEKPKKIVPRCPPLGSSSLAQKQADPGTHKEFPARGPDFFLSLSPKNSCYGPQL